MANSEDHDVRRLDEVTKGVSNILTARNECQLPDSTLESTANGQSPSNTTEKDRKQLDVEQKEAKPSSSAKIHHCAVCDNTASTYCTGCFSAAFSPPEDTPIYYRSKKCQKSDWQEHKYVCKPRKEQIGSETLSRVGYFVESIFKLHRHASFASPIVNIEVRESRLTVYRRTDSESRIFYDFPRSKVDPLKQQCPNIDAILSSILSRSDALVLLADLIIRIVEGKHL